MITCHLNVTNRTMDLVENDELVGHVYQDREDVWITTNHRHPKLSLNELAIIQDNWNQLMEMTQSKLTQKRAKDIMIGDKIGHSVVEDVRISPKGKILLYSNKWQPKGHNSHIGAGGYDPEQWIEVSLTNSK